MTESKYNSVARIFYCKTLSKFHVRAVCNGARRARKSYHGSARERRKKRERKKMSKGHKIKCSSHKVEAN